MIWMKKHLNRMGLKFRSIYLGDKIVVHTRIVNHDESYSYFKISFNFNEMTVERIPKTVMNPAWFEIKKEQYEKQHLFKQGSKIEIEGIRPNTYLFINDEKNRKNLSLIEQIIINVKDNITETYSNIINQRNLNMTLLYYY